MAFGMKSRAVLLAGVAIGLMPWQVASAQTAPEAAAASEEEEILVTANRRTERLQDVPIAVQAVSQDALESRSIAEMKDLTAVAPGLTFTRGNSPGGSGFNMRGVGTSATGASIEQSVGLVVDGVPIGSAGAGLSGIVDVDHIDVLKGPQGTLFGRNASAGLVSIVSRAPDPDEFSGRLRASYASLNEVNLDGFINVPLGENTAFRIAASSLERDGNFENLFTGHTVNNEDTQFIRFRLRSDITENFRVDVYADYSQRDVLCCQGNFENASAGLLPFLGPPFLPRPLDIGTYSTEMASHDPFLNSEDNTYALELNYDFGFATLTSLTSYRTYLSTYGGSLDQTPLQIVDAAITDDQEQRAQEFRLTSNGDNVVDWVIGAMYYEASQTRDTVPSAIIPRNLDEVDWQSVAAFGQATWHVTDQLSLVAGGRYTQDELDDSNRNFPAAPFVSSFSEDNFSYRASVQYDWTPDFMTYATVSTGYKGPAASGISGAAPVGPETSTNYEIGLRSQFFDRRLTVNATAFSMEFEDLQTASVDPTTLQRLLRNGGTLETEGLELETRWRATDNLTLLANVALTHARYGDFDNVPCAPHLAFYGLCYDANPGPGTTLVYDASGTQALQAPDTIYTLGLDHNLALSSDFNFRTQINYEWRSDHYLNIADPYAVQDSYGILDVTFALSPTNEAWVFSIFGRNIGDEVYTNYFGTALSSQQNTWHRGVPYQAQARVGASLAINF